MQALHVYLADFVVNKYPFYLVKVNVTGIKDTHAKQFITVKETKNKYQTTMSQRLLFVLTMLFYVLDV